MTREQLDALDAEWAPQSSAIALHVHKLIAMARECLDLRERNWADEMDDLREALEWLWLRKVMFIEPMNGHGYRVVVDFRDGQHWGEGKTPIEAIRNAMGKDRCKSQSSE